MQIDSTNVLYQNNFASVMSNMKNIFEKFNRRILQSFLFLVEREFEFLWFPRSHQNSYRKSRNVRKAISEPEDTNVFYFYTSVDGWLQFQNHCMVNIAWQFLARKSSKPLPTSDRPGVTMHPAQPDQWQNRWFVKISKVSSRLPKIMLILKN